MSTQPFHVVVLIGSTREGRFGPTVAKWVAEAAGRRDDMVVDVVDLAETPLPMMLSGTPDAEAAAQLAAVSPRLAAADAFIVVTCEYNHSYPAPLKNAIDWHFSQWQAKPIGFVSYGGMSGGLRAIEHLRVVFAELHAVTIRDTISFHGFHDKFDADGRPVDREGTDGAAKSMLDQLAWWAGALREARAKTPYGR